MSSFPLLGAPLFFFKKQLQYLLFVCTTKSTVVVSRKERQMFYAFHLHFESNQTFTTTLTRVLCSVSTLFNTVTDKVKAGTFSYNGEVLEIKHPNSDGGEIVTKK